jgi:hypothetical protein
VCFGLLVVVDVGMAGVDLEEVGDRFSGAVVVDVIGKDNLEFEVLMESVKAIEAILETRSLGWIGSPVSNDQ